MGFVKSAEWSHQPGKCCQESRRKKVYNGKLNFAHICCYTVSMQNFGNMNREPLPHDSRAILQKHYYNLTESLFREAVVCIL